MARAIELDEELLSMIAVQDLFETHITTTDLPRSIQFYRDLIGLRLAHVVSTRGAAFFWIGPGTNAMLGVWSAGAGPQRMLMHIAFRASLQDVLAASIFFRDPDGHLLEYVAMLQGDPCPERGVVRWSAWKSTREKSGTCGRLSTDH